ncbi:flagellar export protein FliJ [Sulfurimonas sp.]|uniref:flagellar export protein FliJ n=1 Tax=Sulfurimonas sp. TaxID=2022749 RepID=UPI002AB29192|nr:flagellar export protein FliJ [Sulfurimonas sp.]
MKTRFTPLVKLKKTTMEKSESLVQKANADLNSAAMALQIAYNSLDDIESPTSGSMSDFLASRSLLSSGRGLIEHNKEWVNFASTQVGHAKEQLKLDMIEFEKFKYLELQEIQKKIKKIKKQEAKDLDEVALMTYSYKEKH